MDTYDDDDDLDLALTRDRREQEMFERDLEDKVVQCVRQHRYEESNQWYDVLRHVRARRWDDADAILSKLVQRARRLALFWMAMTIASVALTVFFLTRF